MTELREFVCKACGHKVVVRPGTPADYTPNICTPCFEKERDRAIELVDEVAGFLRSLVVE